MSEEKSKTEKAVKLPEGVTQEMVKEWKHIYGGDKVKIASLPMDDDGESYFDVVARVPGRKETSEFEKWVDKNPDRAKEVLVNACILSGKDTVKANDGLFFGAFDAVVKLMPVRTAIIKNL